MFKCFCLSLIVCIMIPYLFFALRRAQRPNWLPAAPNIVKKIYKTRFDPAAFQGEQACPICMVDFAEQDEITPLPCDEKHFFHTPCITQWITKENSCPLCKTRITLEGLEEQRKKHKNARRGR
jgi:hypothetical protein